MSSSLIEYLEALVAKFGMTSRTNNKIYISPPIANALRTESAIVCVLKNEEAIIKEWLLHHVNIGFSHFYLYDNLSSDRTIDIAKSVLSHDQLTVVPWKLQPHIYENAGYLHQQSLAFAHAIQTFGSDYRYFAFIDPDEFIIPKRRNNISDAMQDAGNPSYMCLPWHMFGRNEHETPPKGGVGANYLKRFRDLNLDRSISKFKCIVDPCEVLRVSVHLFETKNAGKLASNDIGKIVDNSKRFSPDFISNQSIQLNHYFTRSNSELRQKITRSSNQLMKDGIYEKRVMKRVEKIESDEIEDRSILELRVRLPGLTWL